MNITVNGIDLHYEARGRGYPLIVIGGLTANCREWQRVIPHLSNKFTVYTPENRASGLTTGWKAGFSIEDMASDIAQFIEALDLGCVYVLGHSMGGAIVQRLCISHPKQVKAAVIASSFAKFPKAAQLYIESTSKLLAAGVDIELVLKTIYTRLYGSSFLSSNRDVSRELERMLTDPAPQTAEAYQAQVNAIEKFDSRADLSKITCAVQIINGSEDILTPNYLSEELHDNIRNSTLRFISGCGHMIPQEKPEEFAHYVSQFFTGH